MANWAITEYEIEGNTESIDKIFDAILHHNVREHSSENWEGNVLDKLGIEFESKEHPYSMRGFIEDASIISDGNISMCAEEAWGATDFGEVLEKNFPDVKVYWMSEESGCEVYETNDKEGRYFQDRYYVDAYINNNIEDEYFSKKEDAFKYISRITKGKVNNQEEIDAFNDEHENDDDYIKIFEYKIVD